MQIHFPEIIGWLNWLFIIYFITLNSFYALLLVLSALSIRAYNLGYKLTYWNKNHPELTKPFSLLVPAYNEAEVIAECVKSFLSLNYTEYEVIVINDGSQDSTLEVLKNSFQLEKVSYDPAPRYPCREINTVYFSKVDSRLVVVDKVNGGKSDALNAGANCSRYPYIAAVDSDSILSVDSMTKLMQRFSASPETVGVGGIVRVSNGSRINYGKVEKVNMPSGLLEQIQVIEYLRAFLFGRMGWSYMNILLIISGAFGVFRQDFVEKVKGWNRKSIGEDMDLVTKLHRYIRKNGSKNRLSFAPDPVCWTQVPSDLKSLSGQRDRWQRGLMQSLLWNIDMLLNPKYGRIGLVGMPYFFVFEMLGCIVEMAAVPLIIIFFWTGIINLPFFVFFLGISLVWGLFLTYSSILLEEISYNRYRTWKDLFKMLGAGFLENFGYRQLHAFWRFKGFIKYLFRINTGWGIIKRSQIHG